MIYNGTRRYNSYDCYVIYIIFIRRKTMLSSNVEAAMLWTMLWTAMLRQRLHCIRQNESLPWSNVSWPLINCRVFLITRIEIILLETLIFKTHFLVVVRRRSCKIFILPIIWLVGMHIEHAKFAHSLTILTMHPWTLFQMIWIKI